MYGKLSYEIAADKGDNFLNKKLVLLVRYKGIP